MADRFQARYLGICSLGDHQMNNSSNPLRPVSVVRRRHGARPADLAVAVRAVLAASVLAGGSAVAQTAPTAPVSATTQRGALEEIVVTARYHEEPLQTTPIAITAINAEEIEMRAFTTAY